MPDEKEESAKPTITIAELEKGESESRAKPTITIAEREKP